MTEVVTLWTTKVCRPRVVAYQVADKARLVEFGLNRYGSAHREGGGCHRGLRDGPLAVRVARLGQACQPTRERLGGHPMSEFADRTADRDMRVGAYQQWRVTGRPGKGYPPYRFVFDTEEEARWFCTGPLARADWDEGPDIDHRTVIYSDWERVGERVGMQERQG